jgi:stearoyl-CoA desaturase (delta-9 desaturase)
MKSQQAIDWSSPAVWGLLGIHGVGLAGLALWATGVLEVPGSVWLLALITWATRSILVGDGYHRYFAHRSYKIIRWERLTQFVCGFATQTSAQGGIIDWAEIHFTHHRYSDKPGDPHSPLLGGFWWAHMGWLLAPRPKPAKEFHHLRKLREMKWLNKWHMLSPLTLALLCLLIGGWAGLLIGFFLSTVALYHSTWSIDSVAHLSGSRRYETTDTSRNCGWLSFLLFGEQWHNNHHNAQWNARQGERWYEIDIGYYILLLAELIGWIEINRSPKSTA